MQVVTRRGGISSGSFVAALGGFAADLTPTIQWRRTGNWVTLTCNAGSIGVSTVNTLTLGNVPAAIRPLQSQNILCRVTDNGNSVIGILGVSNSATFSFGNSITGTVFTAAGNKGIGGAWSVSYCIG